MAKSLFTREYREFAELLREVRIRAGLTQVQLAKRSGQRQSYISKFERGELRVDVVQLHRLCQAMDIDLADFAAEYRSRVARKKR
jgi:transcriptional regulator with XRE-family HTH domain